MIHALGDQQKQPALEDAVTRCEAALCVVSKLARSPIHVSGRRGSGWLYPLEDSVRRYCDHIRRQTK
jgi:hypothetical protein